MSGCGVIPFMSGTTSPQQADPFVGKWVESVPPSHSMAEFCAGNLSAFLLSEDSRRKLFSVCSAWYPGSAVPDVRLTENWRESCKTALNAPPDEVEFLATVFGVTPSETTTSSPDIAALCHFAMLDRDEDGVRDYQITLSGRFVENDIDVDQDGVTNVRDTNPVDSEVGSALVCGNSPLPAHLAFSCQTGTGHACELQKKLYREFDIVVINRDLDASPELIERNLQTIYDTTALVFKDGFSHHPGYRKDGCNGLWTMQTVAFEQCVIGRISPWDQQDLSCLIEEDQTTEASAMAHNGLFTIYPAGANLPRVIQLGTYVHEFAHLWQFAYDVQSEADTIDLTSDNFWKVPEFEKILAEWGWRFPKLSEFEIQALKEQYKTVLPKDYELLEFEQSAIEFQNYSLAQHLQAVQLEGLLVSEGNRKLGHFGSYGLSSPWEWHADSFMAYLFRSLEDQISKKTDSIEIAGEFTTWFRSHVLDTYTNNFYHPNLLDGLYQHMREKVLPLSDDALNELVCRYLVNDSYIFSPLQNASTLPYSPTYSAPIIPPEYAAAEIRGEWSAICDQV